MRLIDPWALAPWVTMAVFLLPVAAGLVGTLLPAFGYLPAIGGEQFSLEPWRALADQPGLFTSVQLSLQTGLLAAALSLALAAAFCALL
ncbi:MAG: ABC transporter permease, partial [Burkholderiaceae bacterium]